MSSTLFPTPPHRPWYIPYDSLSYEGYRDGTLLDSGTTVDTYLSTGSNLDLGTLPPGVSILDEGAQTPIVIDDLTGLPIVTD